MSVNKNTNGSIMIAALIVAILTGSLVGLFLKTVTQEVQNSYRSRMALQSINIAEAGLEYAIYSINSENWTNWTKGGNGNFRIFNKPGEYINISHRNETRSAIVYVEPGHTPPRAIAEGVVLAKNGMQVSKQVYIELGNRSLFANGLLAGVINLNGKNVAADSYDSRLNGGEYNDPLNRSDLCSVACYSMESGDLNVGNADIFGAAATGSDDIADLLKGIGPLGTITNFNTPVGVKVDETLIATDFYAAMPDPKIPPLSSPLTSISGTTLGTAGSTTHYKLSDFTMKANHTVVGDVVLVVDGNIDISALLTLSANATLKIYVAGDFTVAGNDANIVNNSGLPTDLVLYGTGQDDPATAQDETPQFKLAGNGEFFGAVYAPNSDVHLGGGGGEGDMYGAIVGKSIVFNGTYNFHYDVALADLEDEGSLKVTRWVELTDAAERRNMATILKDGL